ncbi:family S53 protease [Cylindrobasidium torrendii FP15055 ss-10]|uniref:tripeptidyl-peptidase II n=1 Tax=Cylindrobasidium torrendii FP15055 ss-10 TaxID=1314674 RepID=A0A0D7AX06_9AGAR|nr:family S53 protease [Cylindrobasidium torrendii FP15055 ss-10]
MARLALFAFVYASVALASVVRESLNEPPAGWAQTSLKAVSEPTVNLRVGLKAKNASGLEDRLYAVSSPKSASYGQYLSKDQVKEYMSPSDDSITAVQSWLEANGVTDHAVQGAYGDYISFSAPASVASTLLSTDFHTYKNAATGTTLTRALEYSLPEDISAHVAFVHPVTNFVEKALGGPQVRIPVSGNSTETKRANPAPSSCDSQVTPACLQALYGIPTEAASNTAANELAVLGFIEQYANEADLANFLAQFRPDIPSTTGFALETLDGGSNPQGTNDAGVEADLDIEYTVGIATGVPITFVSVGSDNSDGVSGFIDVFDYLAAKDVPPTVVTVSYGFYEPDLSSDIANAMCDSFAALGARGVSILFASGDGGVSGVQSSSCTTFVPEFPSTCPHITSVGGTTQVSETTATLSGGGFSNIFAQPSYQASAVSSYLDFLGPTQYAGLYNATGRGFPDIAAQAENIVIAYAGAFYLVAGTSAATPIVASAISLVNDKLLAAGKPVLGFLNPFIYENPTAFFDITSGSNPGCNTDGFSATAGWDPATGYGSPNFDAILAAAGL